MPGIKPFITVFIAVLSLAGCSKEAATLDVSQKEVAVGYEIKEAIHWNRWTPAIFTKAKQEKRLILVDFTAEWCQFCKKMDQTTWRDSEVLAAIEEDYIPVRVEDEIDTQLAEKYRRYGRPAIVVFNEDGAEVYKKRGFMESQKMLWTLQGVAQDFKS